MIILLFDLTNYYFSIEMFIYIHRINAFSHLMREHLMRKHLMRYHHAFSTPPLFTYFRTATFFQYDEPHFEQTISGATFIIFTPPRFRRLKHSMRKELRGFQSSLKKTPPRLYEIEVVKWCIYAPPIIILMAWLIHINRTF